MFWFDTYQAALEKRLELQEEIYLPFIYGNKSLLSDDVDIEYHLNLNKNIEFDWKRYEADVISKYYPPLRTCIDGFKKG